VREREREEFEEEMDRQRKALEQEIVSERESHEVETRARMRQLQTMQVEMRRLHDENKALALEKKANSWSDAKALEEFRRKRLFDTYLGDDFRATLRNIYTDVSIPAQFDRSSDSKDQVRNLNMLGDMSSQISRRLTKSKSEIGNLRKAFSKI
jgi:hypothetical protein